MELLFSLWWLIPVTAFSAILTATTGIGGGILLLSAIGLALPPTAVIPIHGCVMFLQGAFRIGFLWRLVDWKFISYAAIGACLGVALAGPIALVLPPKWLQISLGIGLLLLVWAPPLPTRAVMRLPERVRTIILLTITSIISMLIGAGAALMSTVRKREGKRSKEGMLADLSIVTVMVQSLKIIFFGATGFVFGKYLPLLACMGFASFLGSWFGVKFLQKMNNQWFDHLFKLVVSIVAGILLARAAGF